MSAKNAAYFIFKCIFCRSNVKYISNLESGDVCRYFTQKSINNALISDETSYFMYQFVCKQSPLKLKQFLMTSLMGLTTFRNNFLFHTVNDVMELILPAGIPQYWYDFHIWSCYKRVTIDMPSDEPKVLSFYDLQVGFILWLGACGVSFIVWLIEMLLWPQVKNEWTKKSQERIKKDSSVELKVDDRSIRKAEFSSLKVATLVEINLDMDAEHVNLNNKN